MGILLVGEVLQWQFSKGTLLWGMSLEKVWQLTHYSCIELTSGFEVLLSSEQLCIYIFI